jgi:hypothetical protein
VKSWLLQLEDGAGFFLAYVAASLLTAASNLALVPRHNECDWCQYRDFRQNCEDAIQM